MIPSGVPGVKEKAMEQKAAAVKPKNYTQVHFAVTSYLGDLVHNNFILLLQYRDWDKVVDAIVADMDRREDLEKEAAARERATRAAEGEAASARLEQAIALKVDGNALLKQGDLQAALQKVRCDCLVACASHELFLFLPKFHLAPSTRLRLR
jgi:hypothetical protein